jgi:hypothetical protein
LIILFGPDFLNRKTAKSDYAGCALLKGQRTKYGGQYKSVRGAMSQPDGGRSPNRWLQTDRINSACSCSLTAAAPEALQAQMT